MRNLYSYHEISSWSVLIFNIDIFARKKSIIRDLTIDWTQRESVQAEIRLKVKKILRKYGYPPDREKKATEKLLQEAGTIAKLWAK